MTADDVVSSLKRWGGYAAQAKALWPSVQDVRPAGKYAIELKLNVRFQPHAGGNAPCAYNLHAA
jgi:hypothetical protein